MVDTDVVVQNLEEDATVQGEKPQAESLPASMQDSQRLQEFVQTLLAALLFFAVLLAAESVAEGVSVIDHRQECWDQMLSC